MNGTSDALCIVERFDSGAAGVAQVPLCARSDSTLAAGFGGWRCSADAEEDVEHLAHALLGDAELLAGVGEGEPLDGSEAEDLAVALPRHVDESSWDGWQHQLVLVELADDLVEGVRSDLSVPEQLSTGMVEQLVHRADACLAQAGLGGWAEAQLADVHDRTRSADVVADELDLANCRAAGEHMAV
jgi:hypothetical protein